MKISIITPPFSCCQTAVGAGQRALSLSVHMAGGPPPHSWPGRGWRHHAILSGYGRYYCGVSAAWNGWFLTEPSEWEPQPLHSHQRSSSRAFFLPLPLPMASVAWIMERGDDVVRVRLRLWIRPARLQLTLREKSAMPCGPGYGDTSGSVSS